MELVYTGEEPSNIITKSLFLAGGTPRNKDEVKSWRPDALQILNDIGFEGTVFIPEGRDGQFKSDYDDQIEWEETYLNMADIILFWIPRDLSLDSKGQLKMACLTSNVEFGFYANSGKVVLGAPEDAEKLDYLKYYAEEFNVPFSDTLTDTLRHAMDKLGEGAERSGGERYVPLFVWKLDSFQSWYKAQTDAGNTLNHARLLYTFRPGYKDFVFLWILKVSVHVQAEDRDKDNEFVLSRPDISSVCLWHNPAGSNSMLDIQVVLVKEFRSPASTPDSFIYELPSGSSHKDASPEETAAEELHEETGMYIDPTRLYAVKGRQLAGTLSSHKSYLYEAELSDEELEWFKSQQDIPHGVEKDSERTFVEVFSVQQILDDNISDWTTLGQIFSVIGVK